MMLRKIKFLTQIGCLLLFGLIFISCKLENEGRPEGDDQLTEEQRLLVQELNQWIYPLSSSPLTYPDNDLSFLDQLSNAKVVALGEATHGTKEFFQMKHRIFQYLVHYCQHRAFGFEADFAESLYFDDYICTGEGNLEELMRTKMHFWVWRTEEVRQLLEWMREYNSTKVEDEKIHYYGFDCQFTTYHPELIQERLQPILPELWEAVAPVLEQVQNLTEWDYANMSGEAYITILTQLESLENQLLAYEDEIISFTSLREYEVLKQLFKTFRQSFIVIYYATIEPNRPFWRDKFMAENSLWIRDLFGTEAKVSLWAHNVHVANNDDYGGGKSMGYWLNEELGELYQVVGFSFSLGSFTAVGVDSQGNYTSPGTHEITISPRNSSINFIFHHAAHSNFAFHLDAVPVGSQWQAWLSSPRPMLGIGAVYADYPLAYYLTIDIQRHYNWIIHFDRTSASELIPRLQP